MIATHCGGHIEMWYKCDRHTCCCGPTDRLYFVLYRLSGLTTAGVVDQLWPLCGPLDL